MGHTSGVMAPVFRKQGGAGMLMHRQQPSAFTADLTDSDILNFGTGGVGVCVNRTAARWSPERCPG